MLCTAYNWYIATLNNNFDTLSKWEHKITPKIKKLCDETIKKSKNISVKPYRSVSLRSATTLTKTEHDGEPREHTCSPQNMTCDCGQPQENKRFCKHIAATIRYMNDALKNKQRVKFVERE